MCLSGLVDSYNVSTDQSAIKKSGGKRGNFDGDGYDDGSSLPIDE